MTARSRRPWHRLDPFFAREQEKYGRAVPSREFILQTLEAAPEPLTLERLCADWGIHAQDETEPLLRRLQAMTRDGQIVCNRRGGYGPVAKMDLVRGRIIGHPEGFGFLVPDEGGEDLFVPPHEMRQLLHGDRVLMCVTGIDRRGRREGSVVEVLERGTTRLVGRYVEDNGIGFVLPDNRRLGAHDFLVPPAEKGGARPGQIVVAELIQQPSKQAMPIARVREVLGDHMAPGMEVQIAIVNHGIPHEFPPEVVAEAEAFGPSVPASALEGRLDLREQPFVTIDGLTARDFDDAVYCEKKRGGGFRLFVAIADVAHYVRPGTPLDAEAQARGTSVYFPDRCIPMLPEALSNGLCSLNPHVERLVMVCELNIGADGEFGRARFHEGVIRSHARLTYDAVAAMLVDRDEALRAEFAALVPHLERLYVLYGVLRAARERRGAIDFETQETEIEYGPERKIERIVPSQRNDAHKLIEECMIAANVATAQHLEAKKIPALFRIHEGPRLAKLEKLRGFLKGLGLYLGGGDTPGSEDYARLFEAIQNRPDFALIQTVMLRSLAQAVYSPDNAGHFGLALAAYAHFTSPIRRYPDLLVHRALKHLIHHGGKARGYGYSHEKMTELGEHCSMTERRADDATRDAVEWLKCEYMRDKVGETFDGTVSAVTAFGLFVLLKEIFVEGLVHISNLPGDYYHFDPLAHRLEGERFGRCYRLGDALRVQVARVDLDERKIDFMPADVAGVGIGLPPTPRKPAGRPPRAARDDGGKPPARGGAGGPYRKRRR